MDLLFDSHVGRGAFADVWLAKDALGRCVAVKFFKDSNPTQLEKSVLDHAKALVRVKHPAAVRVLAVENQTHPETGAESLCIIMEYVAGPNLSLHSGALTREHARAMMSDISGALQAIHDAGLVHGDLHDANIVVTSTGAKVIDILYTHSLAEVGTTRANKQREDDYRDLAVLLRKILAKAGCGGPALEEAYFQATEAIEGVAAVQRPFADMLPRYHELHSSTVLASQLASIAFDRDMSSTAPVETSPSSFEERRMKLSDQERADAIETLLAGSQFTPYGDGYLESEHTADYLDIDPSDAALILEELHAGSLLTAHELNLAGGEKKRAYRTTSNGWRARERVLRSRNMRLPALLDARSYGLDDVIAALVTSTHLENARHPGFGADTRKTLAELSIYLSDHTEVEISEACERLCQQRLIQRAQKYQHEDEVAFDYTPRTLKEYQRRIAAALGLRSDQSILDCRSSPRLVELPQPPWEHQAMQNLRDLLVEAYPTISTAAHIAASAGINLGRWNRGQAPQPAWNDLIEVTMAQGKLSELLAQVLADVHVRAYHELLRSFQNVRVSLDPKPATMDGGFRLS